MRISKYGWQKGYPRDGGSPLAEQLQEEGSVGFKGDHTHLVEQQLQPIRKDRDRNLADRHWTHDCLIARYSLGIFGHATDSTPTLTCA